MNPDNSPFKKPFENIQNKINNVANASGQAFVFDKFVAIALVVGIIVGFLIGHGVGSNSAGNNASSTGFFFGGKSSTTPEVINLEDVKSSNVSFVTVNKQDAGNNVLISSLTLDNTYWVAVRDSSEITNTPYILGARRVKPGTYTDLSVFISRNTEAGKKYEVVFYKDSIDFNYSDSTLLTLNDEVVRAGFDVK